MKIEALKHAMYFGLALGVVFFLNFLVGVYPSISFLQFIFLVAIPFLVYRFAVDCRERIFNGAVSYGASFIYILQLFFYGSFISTAIKVVYLKYINTDYLSKMIEVETDLLEQMPIDYPANISSALMSIFQPVSFSLIIFFSNMLTGIFVGLICAAFVYRKPSPFSNQSEQAA